MSTLFPPIPGPAVARSTSAGGEEKDDESLLLPADFEPSKKQKLLTLAGGTVPSHLAKQYIRAATTRTPPPPRHKHSAAASDKENEVTTVVTRKSVSSDRQRSSSSGTTTPLCPPYGYPPPSTQHYSLYLPHTFPPHCFGYPPSTQHYSPYLPHTFPSHGFGYGYGYGYGIPTQYYPLYPPLAYGPTTLHHPPYATHTKEREATLKAEARAYALPVSRSLPGNGTGGAVTKTTTKNPPNKKTAPNKKKAVPNKKYKNRKKKTKAISFNEQKGRNFDAARTDCLSLAVSEKKAWTNLTAYCHEDPHLDCPILPSTLSKSLPNAQKKERQQARTRNRRNPLLCRINYPSARRIGKSNLST